MARASRLPPSSKQERLRHKNDLGIAQIFSGLVAHLVADVDEAGYFQAMDSRQPPQFEQLFGELIVLDLSSPFVVLGRLVERQGEFLVLEEADIHDLRDTQTTREKYVLACRGHGISPNRRWTWVSMREIVGISRLDDVINE